MKRFISLFLIAVMLVMSLSVTAFATETQEVAEAPQPRLFETYYGQLSSRWTEIADDNNLFDEYILVTNDVHNPCEIEARVVNEKGNVVGSTTIALGETGMIGPVPDNAGHFTVEARIDEVTLYPFSLTIEDR